MLAGGNKSREGCMGSLNGKSPAVAKDRKSAISRSSRAGLQVFILLTYVLVYFLEYFVPRF